MAKFEKVAKYKDIKFDMPTRKTTHSAGYDMVVAEEEVTIPPYWTIADSMAKYPEGTVLTLDEMAALTKEKGVKPTLVSTGVKCKLDHGTYLELTVRSSAPLKHWIIMANGVGKDNLCRL